MDFKLQVFYQVAEQLSFSKAAHQLRITQPAVSKHIKELELHYQIALFRRGGGQVTLTPAGELLLQHTKKIIAQYHQLEYQMNLLTDRFEGILSIGASSTIAQYVLPNLLSQFIDRYPLIKLNVFNGNSQEIERRVIKGEIALGLVEGAVHHNELHYVPFKRDELVVVVHTQGAYADLESIHVEQLIDYPLVLRENGSGTLEMLLKALAPLGIEFSHLRVLMQLGTTEGIKRFLQSTDALGIISIHAVSQELLDGKLKVIEMEGLDVYRDFYYIHQHSEISGISQDFIRYITNVSHNF